MDKDIGRVLGTEGDGVRNGAEVIDSISGSRGKKESRMRLGYVLCSCTDGSTIYNDRKSKDRAGLGAGKPPRGSIQEVIGKQECLALLCILSPTGNTGSPALFLPQGQPQTLLTYYFSEVIPACPTTQERSVPRPSFLSYTV